MIPNIAQSIDEIIKGATPEQKIIWQQVRLITGENASIRQLYFNGPFAGTEFLTYSANRLFLALEMELIGGIINALTLPQLTIFDAGNNAVYTLSNGAPYWDATAATVKYIGNNYIGKNLLFSRFTAGVATAIKINGFKITY